MTSKEDIAKLKAIKSVLVQSKLEIKGDAIPLLASLFNWFDSYIEKIEKEENDNE